MAFDGLTINVLTEDIKDRIIGSRVNKIHQPEKDEILFHLRNNKNNYTLLFSSDSNLPYFNLIGNKKSNPITAPMFCMLLRKHLIGGRIVNFEQLELERVIILSIESKDELGNMSVKKIIFEIMGKHSNITLVDEENKIIDCIKRIGLGFNRYRQLFPGIDYVYPPNEKKDPRTIDEEYFVNSIKEKEAYKELYTNFQGFGPLTSKEICKSAGINPLEPIKEKNHMIQLYHAMKSFIKKTNEFKLIYENGAFKDFTIYNLSVYKDYKSKSFDDIISLINEYYTNFNIVNKEMQRSYDLRKKISGKINKNKKKIKNLEKDLTEASKADKYKIYGELLTSNIYHIKKGMKDITVFNYYTNEEIKITLNPLLSPSDNAQSYYKKYNKYKTALIMVQEQKEKTLEENKYLEEVLIFLEQSPDKDTLDEIKEELIQTGFLRKKPGKKKKILSKPYHYISSDGFNILVGKNNIQNDKLTLKTASKKDIWLHTKDIPGSHVIIFRENREIPDNTLLEAGEIAAYHSKAKNSSNVPVDYTEVKNIKKPNGSKPGMVIFHTNNTMYVTPDKEKIEKLKWDGK